MIQINGDIKKSLTLTGGANDFFVVNVTGTVMFGGSSTLGVGPGVTASHVLYNFTGSNKTIKSAVGNTFYGTLLAPTYSFDLDGTFFGAIIGGGDTIEMKSDMEVFFVPLQTPNPVPEPGTLALLGTGGTIFAGVRLRRRKATA